MLYRHEMFQPEATWREYGVINNGDEMRYYMLRDDDMDVATLYGGGGI